MRWWRRSVSLTPTDVKRQWWQKEAKEVITEIRSVKTQLATTLVTLQEFEMRLTAVAQRQEALNVEAERRESSTDE